MEQPWQASAIPDVRNVPLARLRAIQAPALSRAVPNAGTTANSFGSSPHPVGAHPFNAATPI
jgi:hypothetical protein